MALFFFIFYESRARDYWEIDASFTTCWINLIRELDIFLLRSCHCPRAGSIIYTGPTRKVGHWRRLKCRIWRWGKLAAAAAAFGNDFTVRDNARNASRSKVLSRHSEASWKFWLLSFFVGIATVGLIDVTSIGKYDSEYVLDEAVSDDLSSLEKTCFKWHRFRTACLKMIFSLTVSAAKHLYIICIKIYKKKIIKLYTSNFKRIFAGHKDFPIKGHKFF